MKELDQLIHQPTRLQIMASLTAIGRDDQADFAYLKQLLKLTDGNLGAHLTKLEAAGYINISKKFIDRKPRTYVKATDKGTEAFNDYIKTLKKIIKSR